MTERRRSTRAAALKATEALSTPKRNIRRQSNLKNTIIEEAPIPMQKHEEPPILMETNEEAPIALEKLEEETPAVIKTPEPKAKSPAAKSHVATSPLPQSPVVQKLLEDDKENVPVSELKELGKALFREELPDEESSSDCSESEITSSDSEADIPTVVVENGKKMAHLTAFAQFAHSIKQKPFVQKPDPSELVIKDSYGEGAPDLKRDEAKSSITKAGDHPDFINSGTTGMVRLPDTDEYTNITTLSECVANIKLDTAEAAKQEKKKTDRRSISSLFSYNR
ncbi:unnamed protein product [Oikopleura dioica]|uniref:Uncharacterized protein n=1 Tax=Oikopleura dioica TaxID=34765 RepID=E4WQY0_OIKDI|nr:unnamed protein product [Oikopleura dioica]